MPITSILYALPLWCGLHLLLSFIPNSDYLHLNTNADELKIELIVRNTSCGQSNGKISVKVTGNENPYTSMWSNGALDTDEITDLDQGVYSVTIDDGLCTMSATAVVSYEKELQIDWTKNYGGSAWDQAESIQATLDGGYIIAGYSRSSDINLTSNFGNYDFWVVKINENGMLEWQRNYGGSNEDRAFVIHVAADGTYFVGGFTRSIDGDVDGNAGGQKAWILHLDAQGEILWNKVYSSEVVNDIQTTMDGHFIAVGNSGDFWVMKFSEDGDLFWQNEYGGSGIDKANGITIAENGEYLVVGSSNSIDGDLMNNEGLTDFWVTKLGLNGELLWQKNYGGSSFDIANAVLQSDDGHFVVVGSTRSSDGDVGGNIGNSTSDYWIIKIENQVGGNIIWQKNYGSIGDDLAYDIQKAENGAFIVVGNSFSVGGDVNNFIGEDDFWVIKIDASGELEGEKNYGGSNPDFARSIQPTADGGYIATGYSQSNDGDVKDNFGTGNILRDFWVVKYQPFHFASYLNAPEIFCGEEQSLAFISVCGNESPYSVYWNTGAENVDTLFDLSAGSYEVVIKADGFTAKNKANVIYEIDPLVLSNQNFEGEFFDYDHVFQQTNDGGFIFVNIEMATGDADIHLVKTNAECEKIWEKTYIDGDIAKPSYVLQTDDNGYMIGGYSNSFAEEDYWILKVDSIGALEWSRNYGGPEDERATCIQETSDGGYLIGGKSRLDGGDVDANNGGFDIWLIKIDSLGLPVWNKNYGGSETETLQSITPTADGGFVLAAETESGDGDVSQNKGFKDYWIFKINAFGILQWEHSYGGPGRQRPNSVRNTKDGGFIVIGYSDNKGGDVGDNNGFQDYWIIKLNSEGILEWEQNYGGSKIDKAYSGVELEEGGYVIVGYSQSKDGDVGANTGGRDYWVIRIDELGNLLWEKNYGGAFEDRAFSIQATTENTFVIAGNQNGTPTSSLMKIELPYIPTIHLGDDLLFCPDAPILLSAVDTFCNDCSYEWNDGLTDAIRTVLPSTISTYQVTVTNNQNGCTKSDFITVGALPPDFDLGETIELITGTSTTIGIDNSNWTFNWSTGSIESSIEVSEAGLYLVTVTNAEGCTAVDGVEVSIISNTGDQKDNIQFSVHPNPVMDQVFIKVNEPLSLPLKMKLLDVAGHSIEQKVLSPNSELLTFEVSHLPAGMYLLVLEYKDQQIVQKIIKNRS